MKIFFCLLFFSLLPISASAGRLFTVDHAGDSIDADVGDGICGDINGRCTLRAAIEEANSTSGGNIIIFSLPLPAAIDLTLGKLRITKQVAIVGPGARNLTVRRSHSTGTPNFLIFEFFRNGTYTASIRGMTIQYGGGIYVDYATTAYFTDVVVSHHSSTAFSNMGTTYITRSLIHSNSSTSQGGAFINLNWDSTGVITNSTITGNSAWNGGAIYNNAKLLLINDTITNNSATSDGSSIQNSLATTSIVSVLNCIIGNNNNLAVNSLYGTFNSLGNNIITDARGSFGFNHGVNNDRVSYGNQINPLLGNLADNGGQTDTQALLDGSPAIDFGNKCVRTGTCSLPNNQSITLTSDQRSNYNRLYGDSVDVGAFESDASFSSIRVTLENRLYGAGGRPAGGALVTLINVRTGEKQYAFTNPLGYYRFNNLDSGEVYVLEVKSKRMVFSSPQVISF